LNYLSKIGEIDFLIENLLTEQNLFKSLIDILIKFRKKKYLEIKSVIYKILSNIFTLDNKFLEVNFIL